MLFDQNTGIRMNYDRELINVLSDNCLEEMVESILKNVARKPE